MSALPPEAAVRLVLTKEAANDPKRSFTIPPHNVLGVESIGSKPHVQRAQYEQRRQEETDDDSERTEGGEEVQERSNEV